MAVKDKGMYCLIFSNKQCKLRVGSLEDVNFEPGYHIYVGSAQGTGGLKRLYRHVILSKEESRKARWHVDYINLDEHFECLLSNDLQSEAVHGFGCSDCTCKSYLFHRCRNSIDEVAKVFRGHGLEPLVEKLS